MKTSSFLGRSRMLMRFWMAFAAVWFAVALFQAMLGYKCVGYSTLFSGGGQWTGFEMFLATTCLILYSALRVWEMVKCRQLLMEYGEFIRSICRTDQIKEVLYQMKVALFLILVGTGFSIFAGMGNHFNWIFLILMLALKFFYASRYARLVNLISQFGHVFGGAEG